MAQYTENYHLSKPEPTDTQSSFISDYCNNMDIIDEHLGQGGGGNVDDVLVNGVSVVDGNHDAQITSYKEVTQAEYDALPATKLTDGIAYFIKDAGGGGSSSHNYSTTEQVIGTWINGKPVYEIVLPITVTTNLTANTWVKTEFDKDTKEDLFKATIALTATLIDNLQAGFIDGKVALNCPRAVALLANSGYLILQYTKTTDV